MTRPEDVSPMLAELQALTAAKSVEAQMRTVKALCLYSPDPDFVGAVLHFVSLGESIQQFQAWASESPTAAGLERLGRALWSAPALQLELQPFSAATRVRKAFANARKSQYPAALCAARRALPSGELADWIQRLRAYLLIRSLDAVEAGVSREARIHGISLVVRDVAETTDDPSADWLRPLVSNADDLTQFETSTLILARQALPHAQDRQRRFLRQLTGLLEHLPWEPLQMELGGIAGAPATQQPLPPVLGTGTGAPTPPGAPPKKVHTSRMLRAPRKTLVKSRLQGHALRLTHLGESLLLKCNWHQLHNDQVAALWKLLDESLRAPTLQDRFGAACAVLAVVTSNSMHDVQALCLVPNPARAWHLNMAEGKLERTAPRFNNRWRANPDGSAWARPVQQTWAYQLDARLVSILEAGVSMAPASQTLGDAWRAISSECGLEGWLNQKLKERDGLRHVRSPALALILPTAVMSATEDLRSAQLLASDERAALPAACTYGAYNGAEVQAAISGAASSTLLTLATPLPTDTWNVAGSELDLLLPLVAGAIHDLTTRAQAACDSGDWVEGHNLLASLMTLMLLTSTGSRPVRSPFQTLAWIDLKRGYVFVEDKVTGPTRGTRLCILSEVARDFLENCYLPHLRLLADALNDSAPAFAAELRLLLSAPNANPRIPLLFVLRQTPELDWLEMSPSELEQRVEFDASLPWNLFRHWMSTGLRRSGVHADIRDALMGHADRNAESHGDLSPRIPADDLALAHPVVNAMQTPLGWKMVRLPDAWPVVQQLSMAKGALTRRGTFGRAGREQRRKEAHNAAAEQATLEISSFLAERKFGMLSSEELDELARLMLFRGSLPHPNANLRYELLEERMHQEWRATGRRDKSRHRYVLNPPAKSLFTEDVISCEDSLARIATAFLAWADACPSMAQAPELIACATALDMILFSGLTFQPPLRSLIRNVKAHFGVCRFDGQFHFEWGFGSTLVDGKPVYRLPVTERAGQWLLDLKAGNFRSLKQLPSIPRQLLPIAELIQPGMTGMDTMLLRLVQLRDQANALSRPGFIAAYLSGRVQSSALPHLDWIRLERGGAPTNSALASEDGDFSESDEIAELRRFQLFTGARTVPVERAAEAAWVLTRRIRALLQDEAKDGEASVLGTRERVRRIALATVESGFGKGDAPFLLGHFVGYLLTRPRLDSQKGELRLSTARRYVYSLDAPFSDTMADRNLLSAEDDELTQWYRAAVASWGDEINGADLNASVTEEDTLSDAQHRTARVLKEFHAFIQETYGADDVDWAIVAPGHVAPSGRPGLVGEQEFQAALHKLLGVAPLGSLSPLQLEQAFVLIVSHRFGLRAREAIGLRKMDWLDHGGTLSVAVRPHRRRKLKTPASRRVVPLLEALSEAELSVFQLVLARWHQQQGFDESTPLLSTLRSAPLEHAQGKLCDPLRELLRSVTRNSRTTLHTLRHSFAMRIAAAVLNVQLSASVHIPNGNHVRNLLCGSPQLDRRGLWAVARLMGHASPEMTVRAYLNCLSLWVPHPVARGTNLNFPRTAGCVDLDNVNLDRTYLAASPWEAPTPVKPTESEYIRRALQYVRQTRLNNNNARAAKNSGLSDDEGHAVELALIKVGNRLAGKAHDPRGWKLVASIPVCRFDALLRLISGLEFEGKSAIDGKTADDWLDCVGANRQILLFTPQHFLDAAGFMRAFSLSSDDVHAVHGRSAHPELFRWGADAAFEGQWRGVDDLPGPDGRPVKGFQLDVAHSGPMQVEHPHRVALIPATQGALHSTQELLICWICWQVAKSLMARQSGDLEE